MKFKENLEMWEKFPAGHIATMEQLAELLVTAQTSKNVPQSMWGRLRRVLERHAPFDSKTKTKDAERETQRCRCFSDIGIYPETVEDLISAFVKSRNVVMKFDGRFTIRGKNSDANYIENMIYLWCEKLKLFNNKKAISAAFQNWQSDEDDRQLAEAVDRVRYDPSIDPQQTELTKLVQLVVAGAGNPSDTARNQSAAETALSSFIYRVKNHMRGQWKHGAHLMPIFHGRQGCGKTTLVNHLLSPIEGFDSEIGFEMLRDNSSFYQLSKMPVMFFDEMAGIGKADVETLKGVMTSTGRQMRQAYQTASVKTVVSTFIGCSNRDIRTLIRDETGNRRFLQIDMKHTGREEIHQIDMLKIWRSVDENNVAPIYANKQLVQSVQHQQRYQSPIEEWLESVPATGPTKAANLFANEYRHWLDAHYPGDTKFANAQKFGLELTRLNDDGLTNRLSITKKQGVNYYRIV